WECKTDMDNAYRFGRVEVSCEGYNHPSDPYVLVGSCGLEYTLELTEEGRRRSQGGWGAPFPRVEMTLQGCWGVALLLLIAFGLYKLFLSGNTVNQGPEPRETHHGAASGPPPPGFKPDYTSTGYPGANPGYGFHSDYTQGQYPYTEGRSTRNTGTGGGGFWRGMGAGGLLGYIFGRQRSVER
ncbi:hypothetical protein NL108_012262, partial [Boleophthalmus pectinirostris]